MSRKLMLSLVAAFALAGCNGPAGLTGWDSEAEDIQTLLVEEPKAEVPDGGSL